MSEITESDENRNSTTTDDDQAAIISNKKKNFFLRIQPMAWLIILGDAFHNFADGLALGAAIVQSLTLGVSIMFALLFHEIPHELGEYMEY